MRHRFCFCKNNKRTIIKSAADGGCGWCSGHRLRAWSRTARRRSRHKHGLWTLESGISRWHGNVRIRRALKVVSRMRAARVGGHRKVSLATPTMQAVQDSWMGLVTRRAVGVWFRWMNTDLKFRKVASKGPLDVLLKKKRRYT
jgi:hypothetical protein